MLPPSLRGCSELDAKELRNGVARAALSSPESFIEFVDWLVSDLLDPPLHERLRLYAPLALVIALIDRYLYVEGLRLYVLRLVSAYSSTSSGCLGLFEKCPRLVDFLMNMVRLGLTSGESWADDVSHATEIVLSLQSLIHVCAHSEQCRFEVRQSLHSSALFPVCPLHSTASFYVESLCEVLASDVGGQALTKCVTDAQCLEVDMI